MGMGRYDVLWALGALLMLPACGLPESSGVKTNLMKLSDSVDLADEWLASARTATNNTTYKNNITSLRDVLSTREIVLDPKNDGGPCSDNTEDEFTLAYVRPPLLTQPIHVCQETMTFSESIIAQVLVHEGVHATGDNDECSTTQKELRYMVLAKQRPFKNVYVESTSNPDCSGYNLGTGINFVILEDGTVFFVPSVHEWSGEEAPGHAHYIRARRVQPMAPLLQRMIGPESRSWLTNILPYFFSH
jgi:hypothetical protein